MAEIPDRFIVRPVPTAAPSTKKRGATRTFALWRTLLAGLLGGIVLNAAMFVAFVVYGHGFDGSSVVGAPAFQSPQIFGIGILSDPAYQSPQIIELWNEEPLPRTMNLAHPEAGFMSLGVILFAFIHTLIYGWLAPKWPRGIFGRLWRIALLVYVLSFGWFEFFAPFNLLREPAWLVGIELGLWVPVVLLEALTLVLVMELGRPKGQPQPQSSGDRAPNDSAPDDGAADAGDSDDGGSDDGGSDDGGE